MTIDAAGSAGAQGKSFVQTKVDLFSTRSGVIASFKIEHCFPAQKPCLLYKILLGLRAWDLLTNRIARNDQDHNTMIVIECKIPMNVCCFENLM